MTIYLLDTNTISYLSDHASPFHGSAKQNLQKLLEDDEIAISILTLYELTYGFFFDPAQSRLLSIVREEQLRIVPLTEAGAEAFATLKHAYRRQTGATEKTIGRHNIDLVLASTAIVEDAVLVSNDGMFETLVALEPRLKVENWTA
jgi:predicted nucleic acid-binding protein